MTPSKAMQVSSLLILVITFPSKNKITEINHIIITTTTLMLTPNGLDWERGRGSGARSAGKGGAGEVKGVTGQSEAKLSGSVEGEAAEPLIFFIIIKKFEKISIILKYFPHFHTAVLQYSKYSRYPKKSAVFTVFAVFAIFPVSGKFSVSIIYQNIPSKS